MNYIGSKYSLLPFLDKSISQIAGENKNLFFCDLFAGSGAVGKYFKKKGFSVISNDLQYYSYVLNMQYINNNTILHFRGLENEIPMIKKTDDKNGIICKYLDLLSPKNGFIYENYCRGKYDEDYRLYFSNENGGKCDAIRMKIEEWHVEKKITDEEYFFLLATLIENIDKVANTASVYGAFLKKLKRAAMKPLIMNPAEMIFSKHNGAVYNCNANDLIRHISMDILYLDPPYNHRQYSANYHLLETIAKYDNPLIKGKTGMRDYEGQKSDYCSKSKVLEAFEDLITNADAKYIFLSYNNEGLMSFDEIKSIMQKRGEYGYFEQTYNRYKADKESECRRIKELYTKEYIHYVIVKK